jgi:Ca-activated chloride channel family protein
MSTLRLCNSRRARRHQGGNGPRQERNMKRYSGGILALLMTLASHHAAEAQRTVIRGRVTDAANGAALAMASVRVFNTTTGAVTGNDGTYSFVLPAAARDSVELQVQRVGYSAVRRFARIRGDTIIANFSLRAQALTLASGASAADTHLAPVAGARGFGGGGAGRGGSAAAFQRVVSAQATPPATTCVTPGECPFNTESYDRIVDNPFLAAQGNPLSTFSIDVDRASMSNIRRFINTGQLPPRDAVRIEEMINYFTYDYPSPGGSHPFSVTTELAAAPWNRQHRLLRIGLQGRKIETANLPASNLVFLIDVSGSMQPANKLPLVKSSLRLLVEQLREQDRVSMVVYAGQAGLVLEPTSGSQKAVILQAIDRLESGGSTAGGAGIRLAYSVARQFHVSNGNNRVILATDGDFNVGVSSDAEMERLIEEERKHGVFLTILGFGMGNYKDSKLERLADKGNGNYAYIDDIAEARKTLVHEMGGTLLTIAKDVKLQVEFNPARVQAYRLIGYENRMLRAEDFNDDRKDAGELGAGHSVTALYEIIPVGVKSAVPIRGVDSLRYQAPATATIASTGSELLQVKLRYKEPTGDTSRLLTSVVRDDVSQPTADFTFTAAIAAFGMILRDSGYKGTATLEDVISMTRRSLGTDAYGYRADFLQLVQASERLRR